MLKAHRSLTTEEGENSGIRQSEFGERAPLSLS